MVTLKGIAKDPELPAKIDRAVFPGLQGGPHMNSIAGIAVALHEAKKPSFKRYARQVVANARTLAQALTRGGMKLCSGGTDTHLILIDLSPQNIQGKTVAEGLEAAGIVANCNAVPYDPHPPFYPSGLRLGTPALTSRGMKEDEMQTIGGWISRIVLALVTVRHKLGITWDQEKEITFRQKIINQAALIPAVRKQVIRLCARFPIPVKY